MIFVEKLSALIRGTRFTPFLKSLMIGTFLMFLGKGGAMGQNGTLPNPCTSKSGEALRECMRSITPQVRSERLIPITVTPDPARLMNCAQVFRADQNFCVARNEVILACRNNIKHPDFAQCFSSYAPNIFAPRSENCAHVKAQSRAQCKRHNQVYTKCAIDPLRYFACLSEHYAQK